MKPAADADEAPLKPRLRRLLGTDQPSNTMKRPLALAAVALATAFVSAHAQSAGSVPVKDWDVFVDLPTGFAFVKTPMGWKFVRQLDDEQLGRLPASTLTSLLAPDETDIHYAHPALEPSPRAQAQRAAETRLAGGPAIGARQ